MQHFLLSKAARTISLKTVFTMGEAKAYETFKRLRWSETDGDAVCPACGCLDSYEIKSRRQFECSACKRHYSVTSCTIFSNRKMSFTDLLAAIVIFVNGAKGVAALQLSRDLDCQYKTAFVLTHKLREAMAFEQAGQPKLEGVVEIDGAYFGGYMKPANRKSNRRDRRFLVNQNGLRQVVVVARERDGQTMTFIRKSEAQGVADVRANVSPSAIIHADEAPHWDNLHGAYDARRINHSECYSDGDACTNQAESFFSRMRRAEIGTHHSLAGPYLNQYAGEMSWREDRRRMDNGRQAGLIGRAAMASQVSRKWAGYWQRAA